MRVRLRIGRNVSLLGREPVDRAMARPSVERIDQYISVFICAPAASLVTQRFDGTAGMRLCVMRLLHSISACSRVCRNTFRMDQQLRGIRLGRGCMALCLGLYAE